MIGVNDPRLITLMVDWLPLERDRYGCKATNIDEVRVRCGKKYLRLDIGGSSAFMLDRATGDIFCIKGYGTIDKRKLVGNLEGMTARKLFFNRFWDLTRQRVAIEA